MDEFPIGTKAHLANHFIEPVRPAPAGVPPAGPTEGPAATVKKEVTLHVSGTRDQLFKVWSAIANQADKVGKFSMKIIATKDDGFDSSWLQKVVQEPLEEADLLESDNGQ